jgi:hypothetical protein
VSLYDQFLEVNTQYTELLSTDELDEYDANWFSARNVSFNEFKATMENWFAKAALTHTSKDTDSISVTSRRSSGSVSTLALARLANEQKRLELSVKAESLKKKQAIEAAKLRLQQQEEELQLEEECAISEAHRKLLDEVDHESVSSRVIGARASHRTGSVNSVNSRSPVNSVHNASSVNSDDSNASVLMSVVRHLNKPVSQLEKFDGNPLCYHRFMRQFRSKVVANCDDPEECLNYLEQYTSGDAQKIVIGLSYLDAETGYRLL